MSDKRFSWMPIYQELGHKLLEWRKKQGELIAILGKAKAAGHLVGNLEDEPAKGQRAPLTEIDPFTFFSSFNRTADEEDRRAILAILKEAFTLSADLPSDFEGIPIISSQRSWFFAFKYERQTDDIERLWDLAEAVVSGGIDSVKPELFDRCLAIKMVGTAKLTMGMFWLNPVNFLALDSYNQGYLTKHGIDPEFADYASYAQVLQQTKNKLGEKFVVISRAAWEWGKPSYWAGGFRWGEKSKLDEFRSGNFWQIGYKKNTKNASGKRCWALFDKIREGDLFAIKGYGGQNDLHIHYLGRVIEKLDTGVVKLEQLDLPHFKGKAPGGKGAGNWQETLVAVKRCSAPRESSGDLQSLWG